MNADSDVVTRPSGKLSPVSSKMTAVRSVSTRAARWQTAPLFYSASALLVALAAFGAANPGGYVMVAVLFDHPFPFGVAALGTLGVALWVGPGPRAMRATGLDGRVLRVDLDPATGRPRRPIDTGAGC